MVSFRLLGPVSVHSHPGCEHPITSSRVRAVLVALLLNHNQYVRLGRLAEYVWTDPPESTRANLRNHITVLRRALERCHPGLGRHLDIRRGGVDAEGAYRLTVDPESIDAVRFIRLADHGQHELASGNPGNAAKALRAALELWQGPAGEDLPETLPLRAWATNITERRLVACEDLAEALLALGEHAGLVAILRQRVHENPLRERPVELLMRALDAAGERSMALTEFRRLQSRLADELGLQPSSRLQHIHHALLSDAPTSSELRALTAPQRAMAPRSETRQIQPTGSSR